MNMRNYLYYVIPLGAAVFLGGQFAQAVDFKFSGEIRPRTEFASNGVLNAKVNQHESFTTMRTRLGVKAMVDSDTSAFIQLQDVRTAGGETATKAPPSLTQTGTSVSASGLDVHQAYIDLKNLLDTSIHLKLGRQEMVFDEHRLIGNIGWIQQAQTFDAIRGDIDLGQFINNLSLTGFFAKTVAINTHPTLGQTLSVGSTFESNFAGERLTYKLGGKGDRITQYFYYALNPSRTGAAVAGGTKNSTPNVANNIEYAGGYLAKHFDLLGKSWRVRFDGAYEFGDVDATTNIRAYMLTASLGTKFDILHGSSISVWYDYLSGDTDKTDTTVHTFTTPYATNHKFYGHMDKFLNIPTQGLQDIVVKVWFKPTAKMKFIVHLHQFLSARKNRTDALTAAKNLGQEIDTHFKYPLAKNTMLALGYSHFFGNGTGLADAHVGGGAADTRLDSNWGYAMVDFKF